MGKTCEEPPHRRIICSISCGMPAETFFGLLSENGVQNLIDTRIVRHYPFAGFADERDLPWLCERFRIRYTLGVELMPTTDLRREFHERFADTVLKHGERDPTAWTRYLEQYELLLSQRRFLSAGAVSSVLSGNDNKSVAVMCHCAHHEDCHRSIAVGIIGTHLPNVEVRVLYPNGAAPHRASPRRYRLHPFQRAGLEADEPRSKR